MPFMPRLIKEEQEQTMLSPFAAKSASGRGRLIPEAPCDVRTDFERDHGRIIYSMEFRRLRDKTQVFFSPRNDHICTRMEHVIYVKYVSTTIGKALGLNVDLIEAIALGHDLGHAPFGHSGEVELRNCLAKAKAGFGFQHELHSLRAVDVLSRRREKYGLNLTFEVRDGIVSHCGERYQEVELNPWRTKTEAELMPAAMRHGMPSTLEGCVVRLADKIAYVGRDIEDAARAGLMSFEDIPSAIRSELGKTNGEIINTLVADVIEHSRGQDRILLSRERAECMEALLQENVTRIYRSKKVQRYEIVVKNTIQGLFEVLCEICPDRERLYASTDEILRDFADYVRRHPEKNASTERIVTDYIAGMTDHYATMCFERLFQL